MGNVIESGNISPFSCPFCGYNGSLDLMGADRFPVLRTLQVIGAGRRAARCPKCKSSDKERLVYTYLKEVEKNAMEDAIDRLMAGSYHVEDRMMLCGQIYRQGRMEEENSALNDITITRCGHLRMLYFQIYVNGKLLKEYHADGIIIATPTGSTGYNMSAGGPLVEPGAQMILLTPVCPHTLQTRSIVLRADDEIIIRIIGKAGREETGIEACFDGARNVELAPLDEVRVTKSIKTTSIIKISEAGFLDVLHRKMSD